MLFSKSIVILDGIEKKMKFKLVPIAFLVLLGVCTVDIKPAWADFSLCNTTTSRVGVALGYKNKKGWISEGWWTIPSKTCKVLLKGKLISRFYYFHAVDIDKGDGWSGTSFLCVRNKEFTITGVHDCEQRGYQRAGFFEINTGEANDWTIRLTDPVESDQK